MGKIYCLLGKSSSGKDSMFARLLKEPSLKGRLKPLVPYTTRPRREGEKEGDEYHFVGEEEMGALEDSGRMIEKRTYETVHGPWIYASIWEEGLSLDRDSYLVIGTLESFQSFGAYFGRERVVPIYLEVEDGLRLCRALEREKQSTPPRYEEMCRRFLADQQDFSEDKLMACGIQKRYKNNDFEACFSEISISIRNDL